MQNHPNAPLIHHVINLDKSRRPSLPSVFEKAAHPSQSIKSALGLSSHSSSSRLGSRGSSSGNDHDPYNLSRPHRSSSKTSLTGIFKPHHLHNKERSAESYNSQPLSPAASTFFTGDDELEQAERDMFMRNDASSGDELGHAPHPFTSMSSPRPGSGSQDHNRRTSMDGFSSVRSRAGSASSAATSQSNLSYAPPRMSDGRSLSNYPMTAPPTQTTFTNFESEGGQLGSTSRPTLSAHTSTGSIVIPQPIPPPPSSSTQPFFSKAAISAAHTNAARPGFYRPRKSSQLSTAASTVSSGNYTYSPDPDNRSLSHQSRSGGGSSDAEASSEGIHDNTLVPPALVVRRPTIRDGPSSQGPMGDSNSQRNPQAASPRQAAPEFLSNSTSPPPSLAFTRTSQANASNGSRHVRTASDGTGGGRQLSVLPDVQESPESQLRASSQELPSPSRSASREPGATDRNERRESEDIFPPNAEAPFPARSRAGSRARLDSAGSSNGPVPHLNLTSATGSHHSPTLASISSLQYQNQTGGDVETQWKTASRTHRSDSTTTDTRTSRSGSLGESGGPHQRFFGFDYSSSPSKSCLSYLSRIEMPAHANSSSWLDRFLQVPPVRIDDRD